jgi:DNA processing protein
MKINKLTLNSLQFPSVLENIPDAPKQLFYVGSDLSELLARPVLTVVGSRKVTPYGKEVTTKLTRELARAGVLVVSGLAIGVDALAHEAALEAGGLTLAVLPSPVERIYPPCHHDLARRILQQGGALITEYPAGTPTYPVNFVARNRIASGLCDALLITEATDKSGTMHTARFAVAQGKTVLAVPGNITSPTSAGTNSLIKKGVAVPITCAADIFKALGISTRRSRLKPQTPRGATPAEQLLLDLIAAGTSDSNELLAASELDVSLFNQTLTMLEITGKIHPLGNGQWNIG